MCERTDSLGGLVRCDVIWFVNAKLAPSRRFERCVVIILYKATHTATAFSGLYLWSLAFHGIVDVDDRCCHRIGL